MCLLLVQVSLFFSESPTNPYLRCIDVELVSKLCHTHGVLVCIDGTFATPVNQQALALGADLVLNSATKYLAGHNDVSEQALKQYHSIWYIFVCHFEKNDFMINDAFLETEILSGQSIWSFCIAVTYRLKGERIYF